MRWTRTLRICGLYLLGWRHEECVDAVLRVPWYPFRAVERAYREAR